VVNSCSRAEIHRLAIFSDGATRLTRGLADAEREPAVSTTALDQLDAHLEEALKVTQSCEREYLAAPPAIRRQINQGLFVKLCIGSDVRLSAPN
jgi:hypothetical protein